jgi:hypothetical protein
MGIDSVQEGLLKDALRAFVDAPATLNDFDKVPTLVRMQYDALRASGRAALGDAGTGPDTSNLTFENGQFHCRGCDAHDQ